MGIVCLGLQRGGAYNDRPTVNSQQVADFAVFPGTGVVIVRAVKRAGYTRGEDQEGQGNCKWQTTA